MTRFLAAALLLPALTGLLLLLTGLLATTLLLAALTGLLTLALGLPTVLIGG